MGQASDWLAQQARANSLEVEGFQHVIDTAAVRHIKARRGNEKIEKNRGQLPVRTEDIQRIPEVLSSPDKIAFGAKNKRGQDAIGYIKKFDDGSTLFVQEVRTGRKELAATTMMRFPAGALSNRIEAVLEPNGRTDGGAKPQIVDVPKNVTALDPTSAPNPSLKQESAGGAVRGSITMAEGAHVIRLFRESNASTFPHEAMHFFVDVMSRTKLRGGQTGNSRLHMPDP